VIQVFADDALRSEDVLRTFEKELSASDQVAGHLEYGALGVTEDLENAPTLP